MVKEKVFTCDRCGRAFKELFTVPLSAVEDWSVCGRCADYMVKHGNPGTTKYLLTRYNLDGSKKG